MRIERVDLIRLKMPIVGHFETSYGRRSDSDKLLGNEKDRVTAGVSIGIQDSCTISREVIRV
jgi:hypothetical protein